MIATLFGFIENRFGPGLAVWAARAHGAVLALLAASWVWPLALWFWRRSRARTRRWSPTWICPACGHPNPATRLSCEMCDEGAGPRFLRKLRDAPWVARARRGGALVGLILRSIGGAAFYSATFLAAHRFQFFSFRQNPLQELLAAGAMVLLLAAFHYLRRALAWKLESPVARFTDLLTALILGSLFLGLWVLWAAAPSRKGSPLVQVSVTPDGVIRIHAARERRFQSTTDPETGSVIVPVEYGRLTWPLLQVDETFVIKVGTQPVVTWMGGKIVKRLAAHLTSEEPQWPRMGFFRQTLEAAPPGRYGVRRRRAGDGLVIERSADAGREGPP